MPGLVPSTQLLESRVSDNIIEVRHYHLWHLRFDGKRFRK